MHLTTDKIKERIETLGNTQPWNHAFDFGNGIKTPVNTTTSFGKNVNKWERIKPVLSQLLTKTSTVLDVGSNDGFFSIRMAEMSQEVMGLDVDEHRVEKAQFAKEILKVENVRFEKLNILNDDEAARLKKYDFCTCLGVLHRLPDPFKLLLVLSQKSDTLILEWKTHKGVGLEEASLYFSPATPKPNDPYGEQFFLPSFACVEKVLEKNGFRYFQRLNKSHSNRALLIASRRTLNLKVEKEPKLVSKLNNIKFLTKGYLRSLINIISSDR